MRGASLRGLGKFWASIRPTIAARGWPQQVRDWALPFAQSLPQLEWTARRITESRRLTWPVADAAIVYASYAGAFLLRVRGDVPSESWQPFAYALPFIAASYLLANVVFGGYRAGWRYSAILDIASLLIAVTLVTGAVFGVNASLSHRDFPLSVILLGGALIFLGMWAVRGWPQLAPEVARMYGRLDAFMLPSLGVAIAGIVGVMAAIGLATGASIPTVNSDSGFVLATAKAAVNGNHQWVDILAPPVQVAVYAPFVAVGRPEFATAVPALFGGLVLVLVVVATWRITGIPWAGGIAALFLLSTREYWIRVEELPAYQLFVFFGYLGLVFIGMALRSPRHSTALAIAGGVALALSVYSFNIGLAFLPAALLLALLPKGRWRAALLGVATAAALLVPFIAWHIAVAGVRNAWVYPHTILTTKYGDIIADFWVWPDYSIIDYTTEALPTMLLAAAPLWLWALAAGGLLVIAKVHGLRLSAVIAASVIVALIPLVMQQQVPHSRYSYVIVPAAAVVSAVGLALALRSVASLTALRHLSTLAALAVTIWAVFAASGPVTEHLDRVRALRANPLYEEGQAVASELDDDRGLWARSPELQALLPNNQIYTQPFFTEQETFAYLLWRDEALVRRFLAKRGIGWILFRRPVERWERDYNEWTITATGYPPRHYLCLPQSEGFSKVYEGKTLILYKADETWLRGGVSTSTRSVTDGRPESAHSGDVLGEQPRTSDDQCPGS